MCEYCDGIEPFDAYEFGSMTCEYGSMKLYKTNEGEPVLVAGIVQGGDFVYFGTSANYCIKCGRDLRGDAS